jgi:hypothetical protein
MLRDRSHVDSTRDFDQVFSPNLYEENCLGGSTTPHKVRATGAAEEGTTSLDQPPRGIRNRGTDRCPNLTTWRVERKQQLA